MSFELKLQNMVLDLKKVESAESIEDLLDYKFENTEYTQRTELAYKTLVDYKDWLEYQSVLILRIEKDIIRFLKERF